MFVFIHFAAMLIDPVLICLGVLFPLGWISAFNVLGSYGEFHMTTEVFKSSKAFLSM